MEYYNIRTTYKQSGYTTTVRKRVDSAAAHGARHVSKDNKLDAYYRRRRKLRRQVLCQPWSVQTQVFTLTFRGELDAPQAMRIARKFLKQYANEHGITYFAVLQTRDHSEKPSPSGYVGDEFNEHIQGKFGWHLHGLIDGLNSDGLNKLIDDWCILTGADWRGQYFATLIKSPNREYDDRDKWFNYITRLLYANSQRTATRLTATNCIAQNQCKVDIEYNIVDENQKKHKLKTAQTLTSNGMQKKVPILIYSCMRFRVLLRRLLVGACRRAFNVCSIRTHLNSDGKPVLTDDRLLLSLVARVPPGVRGRQAPAILAGAGRSLAPRRAP